jgi:uncharacterized membrane protein YfcA
VIHSELISYFSAEKTGANILLVLGISSLIGSYLLWHSKSAFSAMIWPLIIFGVLECIIGSAIVYRTPAQVQQLKTGFESETTLTAAGELSRMDRVNSNFKIIKVAEIGLIGVGILLVLFTSLGSTWNSIGLGLILHSAVLLVFDSFAHHRAEVYVDWLHSF